MKGKILVFRIKRHTTHTNTDKFCKKFYGYVDKSNYGKYSYERKGFIANIPHIRLIRGVLIVREDDVKKVVEFLGQYSPEIYVRTILLTGDDCKILGL